MTHASETPLCGLEMKLQGERHFHPGSVLLSQALTQTYTRSVSLWGMCLSGCRTWGCSELKRVSC